MGVDIAALLLADIDIWGWLQVVLMLPPWL